MRRTARRVGCVAILIALVAAGTGLIGVIAIAGHFPECTTNTVDALAMRFTLLARSQSLAAPSGSNATSTLTLSASSSAAPGTFTVTVTGTSGGISHSASLSLTVTGITGGTGTIQGYKIDANGAVFSSPGATITIDSAQSFGPSVNPYSATVASGTHTITSDTPSGFTVAYSLCVNCTDHTAAGGHPFVAGNSVTVNLFSGQFADLWWQYTAGGLTETATEICGQINPGNVSVSCDPSFDFQGNNYDETISTTLAQGETYKVRLFNIDDHESVYVNGNLLQTANYAQDVTVDLTPFMTVGNNTVRLTELNDAGPWTYGFSRIHALTSASNTLFNESCGQVVPGNVTLSCDATGARSQHLGVNFDQTLTAPFATGNTYSVRLFNIDDHESVYVNGSLVATANYGQDITVDLTPFMTVGNNTILLTETNDQGPWSYGFTVTRH